MSAIQTVTVSILDKDYQVACPEEQQAALIVSASYLDKQMRSIRETGKVIGLERISVMAALNISHELLQASEQEPALTQAAPVQDTLLDGEPLSDDEAGKLGRKIDDALYSLRQMEIG
jgi:cell division protein ZapA